MKHQDFANAMLDLERAINKAHKIAEEEFMRTIHKNDCNELNDEWYNVIRATIAMTNIKCMIHIEW